MKTSMQLKALIRNLSAAKNVEAEVILRSYMMERFLERASVSQYKNNFILKGGMLIAAIAGIASRTTMDMDVTIKGQTLTEAEVTAIINDILNVKIDDNVVFTFESIEEIREEFDYPGYRISIEAALEKTRQTLKIDITTGDLITPKEVEYHFRLMFEDRTIGIMVYNLETVLAEKFETIITWGIINTRMRDFYDIYLLTATQSFDPDTFREALKNTSEKRHTSRQIETSDEIIQTIAESTIMSVSWNRYQKKYSYAAGVTWEMAIDALKRLAILL